MRTKHVKTYQLSQVWWAVGTSPLSAWRASGETEAEALAALADQLMDTLWGVGGNDDDD